MKKILNIALATAFAFTLSGCNDFLDTSSSSVVDRDFVFSNEDSARDALYYGYETLRANRSLHSTGFFWHPVWGSDIEDSQDTKYENISFCFIAVFGIEYIQYSLGAKPDCKR